MQPFDPKLFESQNNPVKKPSRVSTDRAVDKAAKADEGHRGKTKKFKLDDGEKSKKRETKVAKHEEKDELPSAFDLAKASPKKKPSNEQEHIASREEAAEDELLEEGKKARQSVKERGSSDLAQSQFQNQVPAGAIESAEQAGRLVKASKAQMDLMMKQLVDAAVQMKVDGKTETTLMLKHPPMFAGAKLTLTSFDTAKGEFNITFSELTAQAKQLLDLQQAKDSLMKALEEKGFVMHIMVATTEKEETLLTAQALHEEGEEQPGEQDQEERREKQDQDES